MEKETTAAESTEQPKEEHQQSPPSEEVETTPNQDQTKTSSALTEDTTSSSSTTTAAAASGSSLTSSSAAASGSGAGASSGVAPTEEDDESLRRYKERLMQMQEAKKVKEPGNVIFREIRLLIKGHADISVPLGTKEEIEQAKKLHFVFKEGASYVMRLKFSVIGQPVEHLTFKHSIYKSKLKVDKEEQNLGSFPPKGEDYVYKYDFPEDHWPSGVFARGKYNAKVHVTDALGRCYCDFSYTFEIRKEWPATAQ